MSENNSRRIRCPICKEFYDLVIWNPPPCCNKCKSEREEMEKSVRELIRENKGISAIEVEQLTGVSIKVIMKLLENGSIELKKPTY